MNDVKNSWSLYRMYHFGFVPLIVSLEGAKVGCFVSSYVATSQVNLLITKVSC